MTARNMLNTNNHHNNNMPRRRITDLERLNRRPETVMIPPNTLNLNDYLKDWYFSSMARLEEDTPLV